MVKKKVKVFVKAEALGNQTKVPYVKLSDGRIFREITPHQFDDPFHNVLPEDQHIKYFVACEKLGIYTSIGAKNIHHASNKATKQLGNSWSFIRGERFAHILRDYQFVNVKQFGELTKTLQN